MYEFRKVHIKGARRFYFVGALLFRDNVQIHLGGASIRVGASNRDITVFHFCVEIKQGVSEPIPTCLLMSGLLKVTMASTILTLAISDGQGPGTI